MAGRGTDIILGGSPKGIAKVLAKNLMFAKLGLITVPPATPVKASETSGAEAGEVQEEEAVEEETDPDVLSLPSLEALAQYLEIGLPTKLKARTELSLKRAVISCLDYIENSSDKLVIEDVVTRAGDNSPGQDTDVRRLKAALNEVTREFEAVLKKESDAVKRLGGLYVVGTSRHESRRIDLQLRGRAGRQGDPGGTRFFLSLEDDLFKIFGADKMTGLMENFRVAEDMPIESDLVTQALDRIQEQVEDYFRANRQQVLKLDEVTSTQRSAVYTLRRAVLSSTDEGMRDTFAQYCRQTMREIYEASLVALPNSKSKPPPGGPVDAEKLVAKVVQFFPNIKLSVAEVASSQAVKVLPLLEQRLEQAMEDKKQLINTASSWAFPGFFRYLTLVQTDESWCKHLSRLDLLKEEMVLQSFTAERDVMETYRERAMKLYDSLLDEVRRNTVYSVMIYAPK